LSDVVDSNSNS